MTVSDVLGRMQQIQTQLVQLGLAGVSSTSSSTSAASFATALDGATATSGTSATAGTTGATLAADGVTGDDVVQAALQYKGTPYVLGGESKSGIDCSGLVQSAFKDLGVSVPRLVHEQQTIGQKVDSLKDAKPGDLIVLNGGDHIAIYMGNDTVIHAPYAGRTVSVQKAWFDDKDIVTIRRVVPSSTDASTATTGTAATAATSGTTSTVSAATAARAAALVGMYGGGDSGGSSTGSSGSLSSMLSSFGVSGSTTTSSSTLQQLLAAQAGLSGASA